MAEKPQLRRYHSWQLRVLTEGGGVMLGFYGELWADQPDHPAREGFERLAGRVRTGRVPSTRYFLTRTLLGDVLHAAAGVEYHAERVIAALDQAQGEHDAMSEKDPSYQWHPGIEEQYVSIEETLAWDYPDLLTWLRTVEERIDRRVPGRLTRLGLLPAIGESGLRTDVEQLLQAFKDRVGDERRLANYGLHAAKLPDPNSPMALLQEDGTLFVRIPDSLDESVDVFDLFSYDEDRDLRSFTVDALAATEQLIDGLLDGFARAHQRIRTARGELPNEGPSDVLNA